MAMNKREKVQFENAIREAALNRALRWSEPEQEPDVPIPGYMDDLSRGWMPKDYYIRSDHRDYAWPACSSNAGHGTGWAKTTTQRPVELYSTKLLALRAARAKAEKQFAKILAEIDHEIQKEIDSPTPGYNDAF